MSLNRKERADLMDEIARINLDIQMIYLSGRRSRREIDKVGCSFTTASRRGRDFTLSASVSAHERLRALALGKTRDAMIERLHDDLLSMPGLSGNRSEAVLVFGFTKSRNPAISIKIDELSVHDRPLTGRNLAKQLEDLERCLPRRAEIGPPRTFFMANLRFMAVSPEQAVWKWLCFRRRKVALELLDAEEDAVSRRIEREMEGLWLMERHDVREALHRAVSGAPPRFLIEASRT